METIYLTDEDDTIDIVVEFFEVHVPITKNIFRELMPKYLKPGVLLWEGTKEDVEDLINEAQERTFRGY